MRCYEYEAKALFARFEEVDGRSLRRFYPLKLERDRVVFFPLSWTIVHPIDKNSPLREYRGPRDMQECASEFLVLLNGYDETLAQVVHARSSYTGDEVVWGARFQNMFKTPGSDGSISIDVRKIHEIEPVPLPA